MQNLLPGTIKSLLTLLVFWFFGNSLVNAQESLKTFTHEGQQLQVSPTDHGTRVPWGPPNDASGATSLNEGSTNTQTINGKYGNWYQGNYAAKACADLNAFGYSDWYLPSRGELQSLYRSRNEIGGFSSTLYWSSTDDTWGAEAVAVDFNGGFALSRYKNETSFVRCIRRVEPDRQSGQQVSIAGIKPKENLEKQIENALMDFHNQFLPGTDYKQSINYPKSPEYYYAWTSLVIAVGQDIAIILSAGKSEVYVKKSELGIKAVDYTATGAKIIKAIDGELLETAIEIAAAKAAEKGIQEITTSNLSVPGLRSGVAVVGVYNAAIKEEKIINEAINEQLELQQIANDLAPAINNILGLINKLTSAGKISEYLHILESMIERKAELTVYRQMQFDRSRTAVFGIEGMILKEMDYNLALRVAEGSQTPIANRQVLPLSIGYAEGNINREGLDFQIKDFIDQNKPFMEPSSYVDRVFNSVRRQLDPLERARRDINTYGGSLMHSHLLVNSYQELVNLIGSIDAGVRGLVTGTHGMEGLRTYALVVVTDENLSKIYGESTIDASNNYYIPNLPKDKPLYVHFLHAYKVWVTEEITVSDWVDRNLIVRVDTYRGGNLSRQLGQSILGLVGVAGHYADIYIQGQNLQADAALFQKIHYLRLLGQWELHDWTYKSITGRPEYKYGGVMIFNEDGTGTQPKGEKFYWKSQYKRTGILRSYGIRTGVEYNLVITKSAYEDFSQTTEILTSVQYDGIRHNMTWGKTASFTKIRENNIEGFSGRFLFEMDPNDKQVVSKIIGGHSIELDIDPVESSEFNLYFDGIYYRLRDVSHGLASNSTYLWEPGTKLVFPGETSPLYNSIPVFLTIEILKEINNKLMVEAYVQNNPSYKFEYNINDYLGEYYGPRSGVLYSFYFDGSQLHVKGPADSPYFKSGPLIKTGYRTYTREWTSGHGISSTTFTFNKAMYGFITVNAMSDLIDWPSDGGFLFKKR